MASTISDNGEEHTFMLLWLPGAYEPRFLATKTSPIHNHLRNVAFP